MCSTVKKYRRSRAEEYNDGDNFSQGIQNGQRSFQGNHGEENIHSEFELWSSHFQENDGNTAVRYVYKDLQVRHIPHTTQCTNRKVRWHNEDLMRITVWRDGKHQTRKMEENVPVWKDRTPPKSEMVKDRHVWRNRKPPKRDMEDNKHDKSSRSWFKITVPRGRKYNKAWLLNTIQNHFSVPIKPVDFHYVKMKAQFFVQDLCTASVLKNACYKIRDEQNQKIRIFVSHCTEPHSMHNKLSPEQMEQLKLTMNKRYDVFQKALDLQSLRFDPDLVNHDIDMILNRRSCMTVTLKIIKENFPELLSLNLCSNKLYQLNGLSDIIHKAPKVKILNLSKNKLKSVWELDKIKGMKLDELWLEGNPLCNNFSDHSTYVSAIRDSFPKLLCLDGQHLLQSVNVEMKTADIMKPCKESYNTSEYLKNLLMNFLQKYYWTYDFGDRQDLVFAYHNEACFSLAIPFSPEDPVLSSLNKYSKGSRNLKKCKDPVLRMRLLKHTKRDIVDFLSVLPQTRYDLNSFLVDVCLQTEKMLCFSVSGLFKEVEGVHQPRVRTFTRAIIAIPANNSSLCIVNEQLSVNDANPNEIQNSSTPVPTSLSSSKPTLSKEQKNMVQAFAIQSGMNHEWSLKCLEDNEWNYTIAGQVFTILKAEGTIPEEAFKQSP